MKINVHERLNKLMKQHGWTEYKLAKACSLSESTLANIFRRNTMPSISMLETICSGFSISMAQFFAEGEMAELTSKLKELFKHWVNLTVEQKAAVYAVIKAFNSSK